MARNRGLTLVETLMAAAVLAIVVTLLGQLLVPTLHAWLRSTRRSQTQQAVLVAMTRLREEMRAAQPDLTVCVPHTVTAANGQPVRLDTLRLTSWKTSNGVLSWDTSGSILWQRTLTFYVNAAGGLALQDVPLATPTNDPQPLPTTAAVPNPSDPVLAHGIQSFQLTPTQGGVVQVSLLAQDEGETSTVMGSLCPTMAPASSPTPTPTP